MTLLQLLSRRFVRVQVHWAAPASAMDNVAAGTASTNPRSTSTSAVRSHSQPAVCMQYTCYTAWSGHEQLHLKPCLAKARTSLHLVPSCALVAGCYVDAQGRCAQAHPAPMATAAERAVPLMTANVSLTTMRMAMRAVRTMPLIKHAVAILYPTMHMLVFRQGSRALLTHSPSACRRGVWSSMLER